MTGSPIVSSKGTILTVDDVYDNLAFLNQMLSAQGYKIRSALNGSLALQSAQAKPPDLILLDILMPDIDGYEVCRQLKANERTQHIPIIFVSALSETIDKVKAFAVGGIDYLTKPFQQEEALSRIDSQLQLSFMRQELMAKKRQLEQEAREREQML
jgi:PleD family two-component response regulator